MSVLVQNLSASFVQVNPDDGKHHLVLKGELVGHSELQDRLIKHLFNAESSKVHVLPAAGVEGSSHSTFAVEFTADADEVADLIAAANANREVQKTEMGRSYTDVAADAAPQLPAADIHEEATSDESAQDSAPASTGAAEGDASN
jgi:hypothetical protein